MKTRVIIVPLNEKACEDIEFGLDYNQISESDFTMWKLSQNDFDELLSNKVFDVINSHCNKLIDDYENERIENELLEKALKSIGKFDMEKQDVIQKLVSLIELAKKKESFVEFDF